MIVPVFPLAAFGIRLSVDGSADGGGRAVLSNVRVDPPRELVLEVGPDGRAEAFVRSEGDTWSAVVSTALPLAFPGNGLASALRAVGLPLEGMDAAEAALRAALPESGIATLAVALDAEAVRALSVSGEFSTSDLAFFSAAGERGTHRRQAAAAAPLFSSLLSRNIHLKRAVDRGQPLAEALASAVRGTLAPAMTPGAMRRLCQVREPVAHGSLRSACVLAAAVPPEWVPKGGDDWRAFCLVAEALVERLAAPDAFLPDLLKGARGQWRDFATRMAREAGHEGDDVEAGLLNASLDASDMVRTMADVVVAPVAAHSTGMGNAHLTPETRRLSVDAAARMLLSGRSAPALLQASRRWHHARGALLEGTRLAREETLRELAGGWPPLTDTVQAPNGLWLVPLTNARELAWEGGMSQDVDPTGASGLNHCVGGYATRCEGGESHIVSVRQISDDGTYERVSTAEFNALSGPTNALSERQNRGDGNGDPGVQSRDAVAWYMAGCASGSIEVHRKRIEDYGALMREDVDGVRRFCGYDWTDGAQVTAASAPWVPFVSAPFREMSPERVASVEEVAAVAESFVPEIAALVARR